MTDSMETESALLEVPQVQAILSSTNLGTGTLLLTTNKVRWSIPHQNVEHEWSYQHILMHAVSRESNPPSIYCQLAVGNPPGPEDDEADVCELLFVPPSSDLLQPIWDALSKGAALNPDPEQADLDDDGEFFVNQAELNAGDDDYDDQVVEEDADNATEDVAMQE